MNVENHNQFNSLAGPMGGLGDPSASVGAAGGGRAASVGCAAAGDRGLTVRAAARDPSAEAVRRTEPAGAAADLAPDALDRLIKSALDFPPPPMPNFDIMSQDST